MVHFRTWPSAQGCGASDMGAEPEDPAFLPRPGEMGLALVEGMGAGSREGSATEC